MVACQTSRVTPTACIDLNNFVVDLSIDQNVQIVHNPRGSPLKMNSGSIVEVNDFSFAYTLSTDVGSSGVRINSIKLKPLEVCVNY